MVAGWSAVDPFARQDGDDAEDRPGALEPVGLDEAGLAPEPYDGSQDGERATSGWLR